MLEFRLIVRPKPAPQGTWRPMSPSSNTQALPLTIFAAVYARAGRSDEARAAMQQLRRLDPALRRSNLGEWLPFQRSQDLANFADALRDAGLPE
jgi:hypothetical protein